MTSSRSFEEHLSHLGQVCDRLKAYFSHLTRHIRQTMPCKYGNHTTDMKSDRIETCSIPSGKSDGFNELKNRS